MCILCAIYLSSQPTVLTAEIKTRYSEYLARGERTHAEEEDFRA